MNRVNPVSTLSPVSPLGPLRERPPLLTPRDLAAPLAWLDGEPISGHRFLADAARQACTLPDSGALINLCTDRYRFAVCFAAGLERGLTNLFPPNAMGATLDRLSASYPRLGVFTDDPALPLDEALTRIALAPFGLDATRRAVPGVDASQAAACLLTSGSTGTPQPHVKDWGTLVRNVGAAASRLAQMMGRSSLTGLNIVATVPAQHSYGFESTVLLALLGGAAFDAGRPFFPADVAAALASVPRPRALVTTPFHLRTLLASSAALPPVDLVLSATAPLSPQLARQCEHRLGAVLVEIYGCTEAGQVASRRTAVSEVWQTFGELEIHAAVGQSACEGFLVRGGHVDTPTPLADILELQDAHRFRLLGRSNDLIHVAGKRSSLAHLNYQLNSLDGMEDGAFWMPPERADHVVRTLTFVVAPGLCDAAILDGLRLRIEPPFLPRRIVRLDALPREATGKLTDASLRELARRHGEGGVA